VKVVYSFIFKNCLLFILAKSSSAPRSCGFNTEIGYYIDPLTKCTSARRLRITKCSGICPSLSSCCKPVQPKRRYFRMKCANGSTYRQSLEFFKQCTCLNTVC
jgi:hypothetical protein